MGDHDSRAMSLRLLQQRRVPLAPSLHRPVRNTLADCGIAIGGVGVALLVRHWLDPVLGDNNPFATFYVAILFAAWFGGIAPGVLTIGLGAIAGTYFFIAPRHSMILQNFADMSSVGLFCFVGFAAICFSEANRRARQRAEDSAEALSLHQEELERQIVERTSAEQSLHVSEERFRRLSESNIIGIIHVDGEGAIVNANEAFVRMLGYEPEEFERLHPSWRDLTPAEFIPTDEAAMRQLEQQGACAPYEKQYLHRNGSRVPVMIGGARFDPPHPGGVAFVVDLSDLSRARQQIQLQSRVLESMAEGVMVDDLEGNIAFTNTAFEYMLGYDRGELVGKRIADLCVHSEEEWTHLLEEIQLGLRVRGSWTGELVHRRKDGSTFTAEAQVSPMTSGDAEYWICVEQDITQRKASEEAVRAAEERLSLAMAAAQMGTWELDPRDGMLLASNTMRSLLPEHVRSAPTVAMTEVYRIVHPDDRERLKREVQDSLQGLRDYDIEFRCVRPDGQIRWLSARGKVFRDSSGQPVRLTGVTMDVTERHEGEQLLRQSEERFRLAAEAVAALIYDWDLGTNTVLRSPALSKVVGFTPEEADAHESWWRQRLHPDDLATAGQRLDSAIANQEPGYAVEYRVRHREGHWVHVWDRCLLVRDSNGKVRRIVGSALDVSDLRRVEDELRRRQGELQTLIENSPDMIARLDRQLRTTYVNPTAHAVLGIQPGDYIGKTKSEAGVPAELYEPWDAACRDSLAAGQKRQIELSYHSTEGLRYLQMRIVPEFSPDGTVESLLSITTDITEQTRARLALKESEHRLRLAQEAAACGVWDWDPNDGQMHWSEEFCMLYGIEPTLSSNYLRWLSMIHPDDRAAVDRQMHRAATDGADIEFEFRIIHPHRGERWLAARGRAIRDDAGAIARMIGINLDITRRKQAEIELHHAKEVAEAADRAKDHFLAVLSHELRTPLTPVLGAVQLLAADPATPGHTRNDLEMMRRNIELEARLIDDLLDLTRVARGKIDLQLQPCDAHLAIHRSLEIVRPELDLKRLNLTLELDADQAFVVADPARLQQIVWNLLKNAVKFTPEGRDIRVQTAREAGKLVLRVIDTGIGIEADAIGRIFDAFEQAGRDITRRFGGLGLGLAISKTLVDLHGGDLEASSEGLERGSTFTLRLPVAAGAPVPEPEGEPEPDLPAEPVPADAASLRILLVEDHEDTASIMCRLLRGCGYEVAAAANIARALELASSEPFDLVISDLGLPDGSGHDLMRQIVEQVRSIKGIALSGFGMENDILRSREAGFAEHLTKPVDVERLEAVIRRVTAN